MYWILTTVLVSCFGFFRDLSPSDAYLSIFLNSTWNNITVEDINGEVFPWWTYSCLIGLIPIMVITDKVHHKSLLVLDAVLLMTSYALLVWANGLSAMKAMIICSGLANASHTSYYSVLYSLIDKRYFRLVTSLVRASGLLSKFVGGLCGQLLLSFHILDLKELSIVSFISVSLALLLALSVQKTKRETDKATKAELTYIQYEQEGSFISTGSGQNILCISDASSGQQLDHSCRIWGQEVSNRSYNKKLNTDDVSENSNTDLSTNVDVKTKGIGVSRKDIVTDVFTKANIQKKLESKVQSKHKNICFQRIVSFMNYFQELVRSSYSQRSVVLWSIWAITGTTGNYGKTKYMQNLWRVITHTTDTSDEFNGAVKAAAVLLGALCVALIGFLPLNWSTRGRSEVFMITVSVIKAVSYYIMSKTGSIWVAYVFYVVVMVTIQVSLTLQAAEITKALSGQGYGFVNSFNMFCGLAVETVFTAITVDKAAFGVDVQTQVFLYGVYYSLHTAVFIGITIVIRLKARAVAARIPNVEETTFSDAPQDMNYVWSTNL